MTKLPTVGISDLAVYLPRPKIELSEVISKREKENLDPDLIKSLHNAVTYTGQKSVRFPRLWEDTTTMAAQATARLMKTNSPMDFSTLRYLVVGTETTVDHSKPVAAYVEGMLQKAGYPIPETLSTYQIQHACAGGTIGLCNIGAMLSLSQFVYEKGIVICSDIARYEIPSTAEITQGAGAVAVLIERNPGLLELDLSSVGYSSRDVDDFFRPLGSVTAKVKGRYSLKCYWEALESTLLDHAKRVNKQPAQVLEETDLFVLHCPYYSLPLDALSVVLKKHLKMEKEEAMNFLRERGFLASLEPISRSGNMYSGSMFTALAFLLQERYQKFGKELAGKRILLVSYGSGNTMLMIGGRVAGRAGEVIKNWNLNHLWESEIHAAMDDYEGWLKSSQMSVPVFNQQIQKALDKLDDGTFYLSGIREDGYREYKFNK